MASRHGRLSDRAKVLRWIEWSAGLGRQGKDAGTAWGIAGQEILPLAREILTDDIPF